MIKDTEAFRQWRPHKINLSIQIQILINNKTQIMNHPNPPQNRAACLDAMSFIFSATGSYFIWNNTKFLSSLLIENVLLNVILLYILHNLNSAH